MVRLANGVLVVNDCYNSSPQALESMLATVASLRAQRRFAVLGGMMELGSSSGMLHRLAGRRVAELGFDGLFTVGEQARLFADGARAAGLSPAALAHFDTPEEAAARLRDTLREGDVVLLKASRAVHLEKVWEQLEPLAARSTSAPAK
jgi:UDP-N-acetylmuramoyl-tripeptide--D-alanyl-D-alanine ligase